MDFRRQRSREEPEINLIPLIDVLLVIIIFLMLTTTYSRYAGLEIKLPTADTQQSDQQANEIQVAVTAPGEVLVNKRPVAVQDVSGISAALRAVVPPG
ncbi:MAG: biopolymer transporter ExbD, partial [Zoogloea sp.]|nr:biopolymer transporter ExbD [Zoogloea sp.]